MNANQAAYAAVTARRTLPHGTRPTDLHIRVMFLLARWQAPDPPHAKLARAAHCHRNSVLNALHRLRSLGLLSWSRQWVRLRGGFWARSSNLYTLQPCTPDLPMHKLCGARKVEKIKIEEGSKTPGTKEEHGRWVAQAPVRSVEQQIAAMLA